MEQHLVLVDLSIHVLKPAIGTSAFPYRKMVNGTKALAFVVNVTNNERR